MSANSPRVALLTRSETEERNLSELLREYLIFIPVRSVKELLELLATTRIEAVFCEKAFESCSWKGALEIVLTHYPDLPIIVFSCTNSENDWVEALESGAFDLLAPPYDKRAAIAVVEHALASSEARRRLLDEFPFEAAAS